MFNSDDPQQVRRIDPDPDNKFNFFSVDFNSVTREIYVTDGLVYVYASTSCASSTDCDDESTWTDDFCTAEGFCISVPVLRAYEFVLTEDWQIQLLE